jgi:hypothetical protein
MFDILNFTGDVVGIADTYDDALDVAHCMHGVLIRCVDIGLYMEKPFANTLPSCYQLALEVRS